MFNGYLADFSLPEIFQFMEQGQKTGLLTIRTLPAVQTQEVQTYCIWLNQGQIVAASDDLYQSQKGLVDMMAHRGMTSERLAYKSAQNCPVNTPLGLCLKTQGILKAEQLQLLFQMQIVKRLPGLFEISDGQFEFDPQATLPTNEMTGLSLSATEAILIGLRNLRNWEPLEEKFPNPDSALLRVTKNKTQLKLDSWESKVWEFADGTVSLQKAATQLKLPLKQLQYIGFRLLSANIVEELFVPISAPTPVAAVSNPTAVNLPEPISNFNKTDTQSSASKTKPSHSFLQSLMSFLQVKA